MTASGGEDPILDLKEVVYPFVGITPKSTLPRVVVPVRVPSIDQIDMKIISFR